ncbi:ABC transporter substrate-binding protein [Brachyspira hampsonii]|uniref:ABC transporter substrate-binding protein n=2 Tax=Brachyspira hampsonii TaxID=1287055 RepID=A0AAC9TRW6_9SPIR|nr:extracellular solute-binding protein [Brachyspira hampsonii]ASJ20273.1 ABC transporter substrate-binding protein [Brachyspira hampsonii]ELV07059.1 extracellular solute-binding protein [Brachyspira hampsonii 30599]OEJ16402.1 ABC transporter substrate-binding protein [Brachyspira hampsonii]
MLKKILVIVFSILAIISCSKKTSNTNADAWTEITPDTETTIEVWAWNIGANHLEDTISSFNAKYPKIKVNVTEFGGPPALKQKLFVTLGGNSELPNYVQIEDPDIALITEQYHQYFLDLKDQMPDNWSNVVEPSKISTSFDSTGKQVVMPWGIAPAVLFYRADLFEKAGIDINSIVTWDDFIEAGKKLQAALPNTKMIGFPYTVGFSSLIRATMLQLGTDYFSKDGKIAIASEAGIEGAKLIQRFVNEGIAFDTTDWTGTIRASKTDDIATIPYGIWWGGTLKDQAPEMKGKWKATFLPVLVEGQKRTSIWGGASGSIINCGDPVKQTATLEFAKNAILSVENQMIAFKKYGLLPAYTPVYEEEEFYEEDPYFGKGFNELIPQLSKEMPLVAKYTEAFPDAQTLMESAYQDLVNNNADPAKTMENVAKELNNSTGIEIAK